MSSFQLHKVLIKRMQDFEVTDIHKYVDIPPNILNGMLNLETTVPSKGILRCYGCGEFGNTNIKQCTSCQNAYFCNADCQRKAWGDHKKECQAIHSLIQYDKEDQKQRLEMATALVSSYNSSIDEEYDNHFTCAVCLEDNTISTLALPCGHDFCYQCIKGVQYNALNVSIAPENEKGLCPLCRNHLPELDDLVAYRVDSLLLLSQSKNSEAERDQVLKVALQQLSFFLDHEPGNSACLELRGDVCSEMKNYQEAIESFKKRYNVLVKQALFNMDNNLGSKLLLEEAKKSKLERQKRSETDPGTEFPNDVKQLEKDIRPLIKHNFEVHHAFSHLLIRIARCYNSSGDSKRAIELLNFVKFKLGPGTNDEMPMKMAILECDLNMKKRGQLESTRAAALEAIECYKNAYGFHKILAECERKDGNLDKALFYAAKGYFYEKFWEKVSRANNLQLWNDIRQDIVMKQKSAEVEHEEQEVVGNPDRKAKGKRKKARRKKRQLMNAPRFT